MKVANERINLTPWFSLDMYKRGPQFQKNSITRKGDPSCSRSLQQPLSPSLLLRGRMFFGDKEKSFV